LNDGYETELQQTHFSLPHALHDAVAGGAAQRSEIDISGGSGTTPVSLTTTNGGIGGSDDGDITPTKLNVTVPTTLPLAMSDEGTVVTATDCKITNFSYGAVRVKSVTISAAANWHLTKFGDKSLLAAEKVDSNKLGFALAIGGGKQVQTATNRSRRRRSSLRRWTAAT